MTAPGRLTTTASTSDGTQAPARMNVRKGKFMTDQPRDRAGRYQETLKDDPGQLALDSGALDLGSNTDGTFEFPPYLPTAARIIDFWTQVEVPEEVLVATVAAYDARLAAHARALHAKWAERNPKPLKPEMVNDWEAQAAEWARTQLPFPEKIPPLWVLPLVRVAKMIESTGYLDSGSPAEAKQVRGLRVTFPGGTRKPMAQWAAEFQISELLPLMNDYSRRAAAFEAAHEAVASMG